MKKKCLLVFLAMALVLQLVLLVAAYPAPSHGAQNAVNKFEAAQDAMSFAHRAAWRNSPENSLIAIYDCIMMGIDAAEIDLMMTSDGVLVLVHDSTINRTVSGYTGNVSDYTWAKLKTMPLRNGKGGSSAAVYKMDASDAKILNSLPNYATHVGTAASGQSLSTARFDDALDLLAMYGPDTYFTLDKTNNEKVFIASYKLLREKR